MPYMWMEINTSNVNTMINRKECANPKCSEYFTSVNARKRFCSLVCKNQAAYWHKQVVYEWENRIQKQRLKNIKILESLYKRGIYTANDIELKKMGFILEAAIIPDLTAENQTVFRFGNHYLVMIEANEFRIKKVK